MLRLAVLALILLNGVYFAWSHALLRPYGFAPVLQTEPQRLAQQIRPEAVQILPADGVGAVATAASSAVARAAGECLQAGVFDDAQAAVVRQSAQSVLPSGSWQLEAGVEPARWIVYVGKFADAAAQARKRAELAALNVGTAPLTNTALEPGMSLGAFATEALADTELAALTQRGVRTARVVQEQGEARGMLLRIPVVDDAIRPRLEDLKTVLAGKPLHPCP